MGRILHHQPADDEEAQPDTYADRCQAGGKRLHPDETMISIGWEGMTMGDGRLMPDKLEWEGFVEEKARKKVEERLAQYEPPQYTEKQKKVLEEALKGFENL